MRPLAMLIHPNLHIFQCLPCPLRIFDAPFACIVCNLPPFHVWCIPRFMHRCTACTIPYLTSTTQSILRMVLYHHNTATILHRALQCIHHWSQTPRMVGATITPRVDVLCRVSHSPRVCVMLAEPPPHGTNHHRTADTDGRTNREQS
jgi:hypothetical protein